MALTLIEAAKLMDGEDFRAAVIEHFADQSDLLRAMPFTTISGNSLRYNQEDTLPGVAFRGVNQAYSESVGVINPQTENLAIIGGDLDVDMFIVRTMGEDQRSAHEAMKLKALAHNYSNTVVKGDSLTTLRSFDGLQVRLTGNQVVSNNSTTNGGALSLSQIDAAIDAVDNPNYLLMTKEHRRRLTAASRNTSVGGFITFEQDDFGRRVSLYQDLPILIADGNADLFATLANDEAYTGGGTADGSSIYVLALREGEMQGIQNGLPDVRDLGELQSGAPAMRTRIEWYSGIVMMHSRSACRLRDIDAALAVVA